jgi:hypothetical protein
MSLEYVARAVLVSDSENGRKVIVFRTECGRTVKVTCDPNQCEYVTREINMEPPCA